MFSILNKKFNIKDNQNNNFLKIKDNKNNNFLNIKDNQNNKFLNKDKITSNPQKVRIHNNKF